MSIKIMIVDDHPMIIDGLTKMLSGNDNITLTKSFLNGEDLLKKLNHTLPDILLLDIQLPDIQGDKLAQMISEKHPSIGIIALTNFDSLHYIINMRRHGVKGYLLKTTSQQTLIQAIETVYEGCDFLEPSMREKIDNATQKTKKEAFLNLSLTLKEKEVLKLLMNGYSNQDISEQIFISFNTVRNYRARIFSKLDVSSIAELTKKAILLGLAD